MGTKEYEIQDDMGQRRTLSSRGGDDGVKRQTQLWAKPEPITLRSSLPLKSAWGGSGRSRHTA